MHSSPFNLEGRKEERKKERRGGTGIQSMGALDLTVKVLNISPKATKEDVTIFFSYCGTIDKIELKRSQDQNTQLAFVTFRQPYAYQTCLLLDDALLVDRKVRILPLGNVTDVPIEHVTSMYGERYDRGFLPSSMLETASVRGKEAWSKVREKVVDTSRTLTQRANPAMCTAEQTVGSICSTIVNSDYFSRGSLWLSGILDRASKNVAELGNVQGKTSNFLR